MLSKFKIVFPILLVFLIGCSEKKLHHPEGKDSVPVFRTADGVNKGAEMYNRMQKMGASKEEAERRANEATRNFGGTRSIDVGTKVEVIGRKVDTEKEVPNAFVWIKVLEGYYAGKEFVAYKTSIK